MAWYVFESYFSFYNTVFCQGSTKNDNDNKACDHRQKIRPKINALRVKNCWIYFTAHTSKIWNWNHPILFLTTRRPFCLKYLIFFSNLRWAQSWALQCLYRNVDTEIRELNIKTYDFIRCCWPIDRYVRSLINNQIWSIGCFLPVLIPLLFWYRYPYAAEFLFTRSPAPINRFRTDMLPST